MVQCSRLMSNNFPEIIRTATCFCFDFDSTIITSEGIDDLAKQAGKYDTIKELTNKAMSGNMSFRDALTKRLSIIQPTQRMINHMGQNPPTVSTGFRELLSELRKQNVDVHVISGGFDNVILPVTERLGIPADHVHANHLIFDNEGRYDGFDKTRFTSESNGKGRCVGYVKEAFKHEIMVMVGDGMTDSEAKPPADIFIGFGGNVRRTAVEKVADLYITDFQVLIDILRSSDNAN